MADTNGEVELRDYAAVLMDLPGAHLDATVKLNEVVQAVKETGKQGTLTIKLKVTVGKLDDTTLEIQPDVAASIPRAPLKGAVFFADEHGNPTKDDPSALWHGDDIRSAPAPAPAAAATGIKEAPKA